MELQLCDDTSLKTTTTTTATMMKKTATVSSTWMSLDRTGNGTVIEADKQAIMRRVQINARDLRILDPVLSYPSAILGRGKVIVLNLEHIKAIVTAEEVLLRDPLEEGVAPIVEQFRSRLPPANHGREEEDDEVDDSEQMLIIWCLGEAEFAFEFRALEVALEGICSFLDARTIELETAAYPALDELTSKISSRNLDRVRKLKSSMTRLTNRVQKIRDELEQLLDDDDDMAELYLSRKLSVPTSPAANFAGPNWSLTSPTATVTSRASRFDRASSFPVDEEPDVEEIEMLLEAYFMQIDGTLNKLSTLREYIDDTEDYINIQLDNHRNQLIQLELFLSSGTVCLSVYSLVAAIFGMNIKYTWKEGHGYIFKWVVMFTSTLCSSLFLVILFYARQKGLVGS
ncbi:Magnesium transporter MRS2-7 [Linum perenne]